MSRHQVRLLLCSTASVALMVGALFVLEWFRIDLGATRISIELQTARICDDAGCKMIRLSAMSGLYPIVAGIAFWCGLPLALLVLGQLGAKMITGSATVLASKLGYVVAAVVFLCAFGAGYLFAPETDELFHTMGSSVSGTPAPAMLLAGSLLAILALRYAITDGRNETDGEYKPVILDGSDRPPITPLNIQVVSSTGRIPTPQRERIITPGASDRIAASGPGPRDRVPTPGSFERIPLPGHRDRAPTGGGPGPRERAPTGGGPGPRERAATGGGITGPGPGPRERVPTFAEKHNSSQMTTPRTWWAQRTRD